MNSLLVEGLGKRYRVGKPVPQPVPPFLRKIWPGGAPQPPKGRQPRDIWALKDVSFSASPGDVIGVIGPNGAGKTTLLKTIGRVTLPTEGRITGRGRVVSLLELGAGFQGDLSGRENLFLNAAMYGIPRSEVVRRLDDIVEFAELGAWIDSPVKRYSSGMYLRFAFSVAINMEPDILLADEILAVGDLSFRERCLRRVELAGNDGMTVLFVSHDMAVIRRISRRVVWLSSGQVSAIGEPEAVVGAYERAAWMSLADVESPDGGTRNAHGSIQSVQIVSSADQEIGAVRLADDFFLKVTFAITTPGVRVRCVFDVFARDVLAFRTPQPVDTVVERPGVFTARVRIPAHLLSETQYSVNMWVVIYVGDRVHPLVKTSAVSFQVFDSDPTQSARGTYLDRLPGVISPKCDWNLVEETKRAAD